MQIDSEILIANLRTQQDFYLFQCRSYVIVGDLEKAQAAAHASKAYGNAIAIIQKFEKST